MKRLVISVSIILFAFITAGIINTRSNLKSADMTLYYFNTEHTALTGANRHIHYSEDERLAGEILDTLISHSTPPRTDRLLDSDTRVLSLVQDSEGRLSADFSSEFLSSPNPTLSAYGVIKSLCGIDTVTSVRVLVEGEELSVSDADGYIRGEDIITDYDENNHEYILPLYFESDGSLVRCERSALSREGGYEYLIMKNLIKGADEDEGAQSLFNPDTRLIGVKILNDTCFVNLKSTFFADNNALDNEKKRLLVYSAVNSLTESGDIDTVIFLFNGRRGGVFGDINMNGEFTREESLIAPDEN